MTKPLLLVPLAIAACLLLSGCIVGSVVGGVTNAAVKTTGAVASAVIPGESKKQRLARLDREDKARRKAEKKAREAEKRREREERRRD
ncbi:hypothetical protein [Caulobacter sp. NIBR1757]|uniref:hypothetical protein n=1 Tax=Caulobacter sp. NIBR1757 TaxID=3016000 RepID=UPI0022F0F6D1|nr:hypothetical protein [Caulobacter sp. NIBR1757]WGM38190.1 hypothetical protein AMEJIAPC_01092 [Caulobacter sp. NIBR1757]